MSNLNLNKIKNINIINKSFDKINIPVNYKYKYKLDSFNNFINNIFLFSKLFSSKNNYQIINNSNNLEYLHSNENIIINYKLLYNCLIGIFIFIKKIIPYNNVNPLYITIDNIDNKIILLITTIKNINIDNYNNFLFINNYKSYNNYLYNLVNLINNYSNIMNIPITYIENKDDILIKLNFFFVNNIINSIKLENEKNNTLYTHNITDNIYINNFIYK